MLTYRTPGAYFDWLDERPPVIEPLRTDVAGFVGLAERGPLHEAVKVESWSQFTATFGSFISQGYLAYAVEGFFGNGGRTCWVVRAADPATARQARLELRDDGDREVLRLEANSPGAWGRGLSVRLVHRDRQRFDISVIGPGAISELWRGLTIDTIEAVINGPGGSRVIVAGDLRTVRTNEDRPATAGPLFLDGGTDGIDGVQPFHLTGLVPMGLAVEGGPFGLEVLAAIEDVSIVAIPDASAMDRPTPRPHPTEAPDCDRLDAPPPTAPRPSVSTEFPVALQGAGPRMQEALIAHCERLRDRVAILDAPSRSGDLSQVLDLQGLDSAYAALYYPWLKVSDHLELDGSLREVPPCGHVAGIYARGDVRIGVHKPPANERISGARDVTAAVDDAGHADLNDAGVNVIRAYPGRGIRVFGARTRSADPDWRYVNVRRLLIMIEQAIEEQCQWIVFEPNDQNLWRDVDRVVRAFVDRLWRLGMLDGATAEEAYFVRCDETTNPPDETDIGRLTCLVGVQPPWPAEFVVARIRKTEGQIETLEWGRRDA
jgi:phage tail sheath protein FI